MPNLFIELFKRLYNWELHFELHAKYASLLNKAFWVNIYLNKLLFLFFKLY